MLAALKHGLFELIISFPLIINRSSCLNPISHMSQTIQINLRLTHWDMGKIYIFQICEWHFRQLKYLIINPTVPRLDRALLPVILLTKMQYLIYTINLTSNRDKQLREHMKNQGAIHKRLRALKFRSFKCIKHTPSIVWVRYFVQFQMIVWNCTQNILLIHWKIRFSCNVEILRAHRFNMSFFRHSRFTEAGVWYRASTGYSGELTQG